LMSASRVCILRQISLAGAMAGSSYSANAPENV
jgi:hypothetical protein